MNKSTGDRDRYWQAVRTQLIFHTDTQQGLDDAMVLINEFEIQFKSLPNTIPMKQSLLKYYSEQEIVVNRTTPKHDTIHNSTPSLGS